ncbi:gamma-glutamyltransferase [Pseudoalteromonas sp. McH1-7]|uniref:Glutathione hydrolase proenzyme n=1 Tax=Pseudoalteromonas peptidolytica F12-50-A1 TaxID=1315280 RepID=A0A8I0MXB2_9GAMM|nr:MULTISPECIES: gamma-glutamyltransferase [Pseudoalteromonas]MBE0347006.1 gamma-glutamyltranspeptidase [Pseudoalteromonas peptidolytica F12-50-A1]NLR14060.1 gamma-glutamyltransferase [Pseudoalteromonas peptidolytica]NUZ11712.1 gamma-glutamyltransferase [Pseudoalteromonas sp. McH1-7]USD29503.1 gamma-glutamyltransferase [Pseudoalteromonas sp. SCSIO 43201]GEK11012.1 gamma-glutamyltransferase [Pseudoalteromonas peptidolytica]
MRKLTALVWSCSVSLCVGAALGNTAHADESPIFSSKATAQPIWAEHGMVSSQEALASQIGVEILKQGGNAVDAAVAVGFSLAVTLPRAGNIGGGGFMLVHLAKENKTIAIDYREMAPSSAHKGIFLDENGEVDPKLSLQHGLAVGVPGTVMGMELALKKYGTMTLSQVMQPAIKLARDGIKVTSDLANSLSHNYIKQRMLDVPASKAIFYKEDGSSYKPNEWLVQTDLAHSLTLIAEKGSAGFYQGETAKKIVAAVEAAGGIMTLDDLKAYKALERQPLTGSYRGYEIISMPPPSSGGVHIIEMLNMLEQYPIGELGHNSAATIHLMAEVMKRAYADRSEYLGDPDFYDVPVEALVDKQFAKQRSKKIHPDKATPSSEIKPGKLLPFESNQTTHYSVVDKWGNAVSNTYTLNFSYGSGIVAAGTGILLNNEMDDFSAKPGSPNGFGLVGGEANAVEGKKRPLSSMTPTIVMKEGKPFLVTGSPGGSRIITTTLQVIMNVIDHGLNIAEATVAPRIHHQWLPDEIRIERSLNGDTRRLLESKGHRLSEKNAMGSTQSIMLTDKGLFGSSDPRRADSAAVGY